MSFPIISLHQHVNCFWFITTTHGSCFQLNVCQSWLYFYNWLFIFLKNCYHSWFLQYSMFAIFAFIIARTYISFKRLFTSSVKPFLICFGQCRCHKWFGSEILRLPRKLKKIWISYRKLNHETHVCTCLNFVLNCYFVLFQKIYWKIKKRKKKNCLWKMHFRFY